MAEKPSPGSSKPRMTTPLANLASMSDHNFVELEWENVQVLTRGPSRRARNNPQWIGYSSRSSKGQEETGGDSSTAKRAKFETVDSIFSDYPLLGLSGRTKLDNHDEINSRSCPNQTHGNSLQYYYPKSFTDLYETEFNDILEHKRSKSCYDTNLTGSQIVPVHECKKLEPGYSSKYPSGIAQRRTKNSSQLPQSSLQQCQASAPFMRSQGNSSQTPAPVGGLHDSKSQEQLSGTDKTKKVNFSLFLRPQALLKANSQNSGGTRPLSCPDLSRAEELKSNDRRSAPGSSNPVELMLIEQVNGSKSITGLQNQPNSTTKLESMLPNTKPLEESLPNEKSAAVVHKLAPTGIASYQVHDPVSRLPVNTPKKSRHSRRSIEPLVASSSVSSRGASNDPTYTLKRRYEDTDGSTYLSEEEPEGVRKPVPARGSKAAKRSRTAEVHNLSERKRRDKINKKMSALQELIPNCNKVDKASMLDEAIQYLKTLQLQVQMMSMGTGFFMPPMMLPIGMQQLNAQHLAHYSPMGVDIGMRMHMGFGCSPVQFLASPISGATGLPGITEARLHMLGFPGQAVPMSASRSPFLSSFGGSSMQSVLVPGVSGPAASVQLRTSAPLSSSKDSMQINQEIMNKINPKCTKI